MGIDTLIRFSCNDDGSRTIIGIAGRLDANHLAEFEVQRAAARHTVVLDLSELRSADEAAIRCLRSFIERGDRVTGASPYIGFRLERGRGSQSAVTTH